MMMDYEYVDSGLITEETQLTKILISIICLYGEEGLPLKYVNKEFENYCGHSIPYKKFGADSLRSWLLTLPDIYIVRDSRNNEVLIEQSVKSMHIKELILRQKNRHQPPQQRKRHINNSGNNGYYRRNAKIQRRNEHNYMQEGSFIHTSINNNASLDSCDRYEKFEELESMLPLFYKHQALGDDFFLDIADRKLGYYVPENGPKRCGLCVSGQTIADLTANVKRAVHLAPRVVVMVGFQDLILGKSISSMITDLRQLIIELKRKNSRVTLITLIPSPKLFSNDNRYQIRMDIYNKAILDYGSDPFFKCNVIDMYTMFQKEAESFRKDFDRFVKITRNDPYQVFSDYGRKIFLSGLKSSLRQQIEYGH